MSAPNKLANMSLCGPGVELQGNEAGCDGADDEEAEVFCDGQGEVEQADFVVLDMFI